MGNKIITIIVPSYNMEKYLPSCLGSLVVSPDWLHRVEVLVVNDGSTDRTSEIAHEFASRYPQTFVVIDKTNGHYGSCINAALKVATGTFVKVLDADDSFDTGAFEQMVEALSRSEAAGEDLDLVLTDFIWVNESGNAFRYTRQTLPADKVLQGTYLGRLGMQYMHAITYRTEMLRTLGYRQTEGICYTDNEWACYPMRGVKRARYVPLQVYRYLYGRPGQSMDPKVLAKNWGMKARVSLRMVKELGDVSDAAGALSPYLAFFTAHQVAQLYTEAILDFPSAELDAALLDFDVQLERQNPKLRKVLFDEKLISRKINFHYARVWRACGSSQTFKLRVFRFYRKCARLLVR